MISVAITTEQAEKLKEVLGSLDEETRRELAGLPKEAPVGLDQIQVMVADQVKQARDAEAAERKAAAEAAEANAFEVEQAKLAERRANGERLMPEASVEDAVPDPRYKGAYRGLQLAEQITLDTLIQLPASEFGDYASTVEALQRTNDDFLAYQYLGGSQGQRRKLTSNPRWNAAWTQNKTLRTDVGKLVQKALYSTGAAVGDEWVPTVMSAQWVDKVYEAGKLAPLFPRLNMVSNPQLYPIWAGQSATAYLAGESTQDEDTKFTPSNTTTGQLSLTAKKFVVRTLYSEEMADDSIAGSIDRVKQDIANSGAYYLDQALLDGDTTATSFDTGVTRAANDVRRAWDGVRHWAHVTATGKNINASASGAVSFSCANSVLDALAGMGMYMGDNPVGIVSYKMGKRFGLVTNPSNNLVNAPYAEGGATRQAPKSFLGVPFVDTPHVLDTLTSAGIYDGTTTAYTEVLWVNRDAFFIGDRRDWRLDVAFDIATQQWQVVLSWRGAFSTPYTSSVEYIASACTGIYSS